MRVELLTFFLLAGLVQCRFNANFYNYLVGKFGKAIADDLTRSDLGAKGSFGGGNPNASVLPVIVVHGLAGTAGLLRTRVYNKYLSYGQPRGTVFGTTYANGDLMHSLAHGMQCDYVLKVRTLILAVHEYTKKKVNIIAFSMGSPISRKAILGGRCVDTGTNLGAPISSFVHNFVSVAGANNGAHFCTNSPFFHGICSPVNGLDCDSKFIKEINSDLHYEGKNVFSIYSTADEVVGLMNNCHQRSSMIDGAVAIERDRLMHGAVIGQTTQEQWRALSAP
ncbi:unnamed protein product [Caenorhabditis auriculariae]|uniref:Uncharacterized protein n=1 Tax=Caenorhabditis auriculariae TaxID=2777116 RepID=A0A8S1HBP2_9PELO|nr:unnamed protein product [Caenorhabditis auriculariae]